MDEHDPMYIPEPQESWRQFFAALGRASLLAISVGLFLWGFKLLEGFFI